MLQMIRRFIFGTFLALLINRLLRERRKRRRRAEQWNTTGRPYRR